MSTIVRIRKVKRFEAVLEIPTEHGDAGAIAKRLRMSGYDARTVGGEVIVNARAVDERSRK